MKNIVQLLVFTEILQVIPLLQDVSVSMADTLPQITSPLNPEKPQYNQVSTMLTLKWWENVSKNDTNDNIR